MSVGQSVQKVCSCGRPTYGASECRRCAAIARAQHTDRMAVWPDTLCSDDPDPDNLESTDAARGIPSKRTGTVRAVEQPNDAKTASPKDRIADIRRRITTGETE